MGREIRGAVKHSPMHSTAPVTRDYPSQNVNSAKVRKLWSRGKAQAWFLTLKCPMTLKELSLFQCRMTRKHPGVASGDPSIILARVLSDQRPHQFHIFLSPKVPLKERERVPRGVYVKQSGGGLTPILL